MNVFLVGFMGSGKSKLGKKLASRLELPFLDLDELIENEENMTISQIFNSKGEAYFRESERTNLFKFYAEKKVLLSLGGGACCNESSWKFLEENGLIIYIKEPSGILYGRLKKEKSKRPLIANLADGELKEYIDQKLEERSIFYERAHFIYEKEKSSLDFLVNQIRNYLR